MNARLSDRIRRLESAALARAPARTVRKASSSEITFLPIYPGSIDTAQAGSVVWARGVDEDPAAFRTRVLSDWSGSKGVAANAGVSFGPSFGERRA